ncbi:hypothetical protein G9A89_022741 [Geosiphon pyriformis]|nr:hypothetical protein G9A89_022741 [Geosiphon pyriformis]
MDGSLCDLGTVDMKAGTTIFFENINLGLGVVVFGLVSFTLMELQAIALAFECVSSFYLVDLFSDSQATLDACRSESLLHHHIANIICHKNLDVNWYKVKSHSDISDNKHTNVLAKDAAFSAWHLSHLVSKHFLSTGSTAVSGNSKHFVHDVFHSVYHSSLVWHSDSHLAAGFTSVCMADCWTYFMKALHHWLLVAVRKHLYNRSYSNVVCLYCGDVEVSDHIFSCPYNAADHAQLLDTYALAWEALSGLFQSSSCVSQLLTSCISKIGVGIALCKDFVFNNWYHESVLVFKDFKIGTKKVVDFVHDFCLIFQDNIWLVRTKYQAFMEKYGLISHDSFIPALISGLPMAFSASVVRLLDMAEAFGVGFGFRKFCLFFSSVGDLVSVHIGV